MTKRGKDVELLHSICRGKILRAFWANMLIHLYLAHCSRFLFFSFLIFGLFALLTSSCRNEIFFTQSTEVEKQFNKDFDWHSETNDGAFIASNFFTNFDKSSVCVWRNVTLRNVILSGKNVYLGWLAGCSAFLHGFNMQNSNLHVSFWHIVVVEKTIENRLRGLKQKHLGIYEGTAPQTQLDSLTVTKPR